MLRLVVRNVKAQWLTFALLGLWNCAAAEADKAAAGPFAVDTLKVEWRDAERERDVPAKIYFPKNATGACPVIVFSHGLGGTRDGYEYLGRHWASHGYMSVHLQHHGSDDAAWSGTARPVAAMRAATMNVANSVNRPLDVSFALDELTKLNQRDGALRGRLDLGQVGMAGHSYGAFTTLAIAGQSFGPAARSFADSRVKAAIAMSAPVPRQTPERHYENVRVPVFHLTGTEDESPINDTSAKDRRIPFDSIQRVPQFLITFDGGDHMIFAGRSTKLSREKSAAMLEAIRGSTTSFWDACLRDDPAAKQWLADGGAKAALGRLGVFEKKSGATR